MFNFVQGMVSMWLKKIPMSMSSFWRNASKNIPFVTLFSFTRAILHAKKDDAVALFSKSKCDACRNGVQSTATGSIFNNSTGEKMPIRCLVLQQWVEQKFNSLQNIHVYDCHISLRNGIYTRGKILLQPAHLVHIIVFFCRSSYFRILLMLCIVCQRNKVKLNFCKCNNTWTDVSKFSLRSFAIDVSMPSSVPNEISWQQQRKKALFTNISFLLSPYWTNTFWVISPVNSFCSQI